MATVASWLENGEKQNNDLIKKICDSLHKP